MGRTVLLLAAVAAGYLVVYLLLKRRIARMLSAATVLREVREEVNRILVELNQTTHRNVTLLEDRIAALGDMLARADKKLALARREEEKQELAGRVYSALAGRRKAPATAATGPVAAEPLREAGAQPQGRREEAAEDRREEEAPAEDRREEAGSAANRREEAVRLGQAGLSPSLIARRLGLTLGEVELILSLAEHRR